MYNQKGEKGGKNLKAYFGKNCTNNDLHKPYACLLSAHAVVLMLQELDDRALCDHDFARLSDMELDDQMLHGIAEDSNQ